MTSKFSIDNRELLQKISNGEAAAGIDFGNAIVRELAAFRLAAMDSEPVAEVVSMFGDPEAFGERELKLLVGIQNMPYGTKFYRHAQPAPVVPDDFVAWAKNEGLKHELYGLRSVNNALDVARKAWNAGRAAMLQAGNSPAHSGPRPEQISDSPAQCSNSPVIPDGYVMVPVPDEFLSAEQNASGMFELSEDCMCRLAVALSQQSKGLVTPPGYVMVPKEPTEDMCFAPDVPVGNKTWDGYQSSADMAECKAIYEAMLAAALQEVK